MAIKLINEREYQKRLKEITKLHSYSVDNSLKVQYSLPVLKKAGQIFEVFPPNNKTKRLNAGSCYPNSVRRMNEGFKYVEGVIISKDTDIKISHAWNVDSDGKHIDFTIMNTHEYEYNGLIIPSEIVYEVGEKNGHIWYCCLPYIKVEKNKNFMKMVRKKVHKN